MPAVLIIPEYIIWHYTAALRLFLNIVTNFVWFFYHFFSIPILVQTFFSPWRRLHEQYRGGLHLVSFAEAAVVNIIMRLVGMVLRTFVVIFGSIVCLATLVLGLVLLVVWLALPLVVVAIFFKGLGLLLHDI